MEEPAQQQTEKPKSPIGTVMVGSAIDNRDSIQTVGLCVNGEVVRLSVVGARLLAKQINDWADLAEKKNEENRTIHLTYRVVPKQAAEETSQWVAVARDELAVATKAVVASKKTAISKRSQKRVRKAA